MANWTNEQKQAIDIRDKNVLLSAAAGSGKTAVLVERIISIITDEDLGVDVDNLLVVTFTNAAAAEMKERIAAAVSAKIEENPESEHLHKQLALLGRSNITTIHSFCKKIIAENYVKLDIEPSVRVADESECSLLKVQAMEEFLEESFEDEENYGFFMLAESFGDEKDFSKLRENILNLYESIQSMPFPKLWLDEACKKYSSSGENTYFTDYLLNNAYLDFKGLYEKSHSSINYVPDEYKDAFINDCENFKMFMDLCEKRDISRLYDEVNSFSFQSLKRKKKDTPDELAQIGKDIRSEIKKAFEKTAELYFFASPEIINDDMAFCKEVVENISKAVIKFEEKYTALKKEKAIVDFNDLEHLAIKALYDFDEETGTYKLSKEAYLMQSEFYEVLTDEYQDSNSVQEMILSALSGRGENKSNRFVVGDIKQSIYRFRQTDPEIFLNKLKLYEENDEGSIIYLSKNFRSRENILNGINYIFKQLMTEENGEIEYEGREELHYGADFPAFEKEEVQKPIEFNVIALKNDASFEDTDEEIEDFDSARKELTFVAGRIKELFKEDFQVRDKKTGEYRSIKYSDIVILLRSAKTWANAAEEVFEYFGIPIFTGTGSGYFDKNEVAVIVSILRIIDNAYEDIPVITVLKSFIYSVTDEELAEIKISAENNYFYENVVNYAENGENTEIIEKLKSFISDIEKWKEMAPFISVRELMWQIYTETGYYDYTGALPNGEIKQANLNLLLEKAQTAESWGVKSLFDFIGYIEKLQKNAVETSEAGILNENENVVRLMTIHKSKGLEFPVVFVSGLGKKFNMSDVKDGMLIHKELGIGLDFLDSNLRIKRKTLPKNIISKKIKDEMTAEEMRILYVALTRAKEKLILTGGVNDIESRCIKWTLNGCDENGHLSSYYVKKSITYIDWIGAALSRHKDCSIISDFVNTAFDGNSGIYTVNDDKSIWKTDFIYDYSYYFKNAENTEKEVTNENMISAGEDIENEIYEKFMFQYPYKIYEDVAANISISEIKRNYQKELIIEDLDMYSSYKMPEFTAETKGLTASQKGTALHTVMRHIDLKKQYTKESLLEEISIMTEKSILTPEEAASVNIWAILKFLSSPLAERIRNAKVVEREKPFAIEISAFEAYGKDEYKSYDDGVLVHGIIDCYFYDGKTCILLDYKTDYVPKGEEEGFFDKYKIQLDIYSKAIERTTPFKVNEKYIYSFGLGKEIKM